MAGELHQFCKYDQERIYQFGRELNHGNLIDQVIAERELRRFVSELAAIIDNRKDQAAESRQAKSAQG